MYFLSGEKEHRFETLLIGFFHLSIVQNMFFYLSNKMLLVDEEAKSFSLKTRESIRNI